MIPVSWIGSRCPTFKTREARARKRKGTDREEEKGKTRDEEERKGGWGIITRIGRSFYIHC